MASPTQIGISTYAADSSRPSATRSIAFLVAAGLINASIAAYLLCPLPPSHHPTLTALLVRASLYVTGAALAGMAGAWFYWTRPSTPFRANPPLSFPLFALTNAAAWVWIPSIVLFSGQDSPASASIAALAAALLATGLRKALLANTLEHQIHNAASEQAEIFAATLHTPPREVHGYLIAVSLYVAAFQLRSGSNLYAAGLLAPCAFFVAWKLTLAPSADTAEGVNKRATLRLALVVPAAIFITLLALLFGVAHRERAEAMTAASARAEGVQSAAASQKSRSAQNAAPGISGYESIILWPIPEKKQIVPPLPAPASLLAPGTTRPLIIRFDGAYWYFQPPDHRPNAAAHRAQGTPVAIDIHAHNFIPLVMKAHQNLGSPIPLARCGEIQVGILNNDNHPGPVSVGVLLTDTSLPGKPQLYLGQRPIASSQPGRFVIKSAPAAETLRFPIGIPAKIRKFDEITVMFFPDGSNFDQGPKVAIDQFQLIPR